MTLLMTCSLVGVIEAEVTGADEGVLGTQLMTDRVAGTGRRLGHTHSRQHQSRKAAPSPVLMSSAAS
jgi:hypothetical protein